MQVEKGTGSYGDPRETFGKLLTAVAWGEPRAGGSLQPAGAEDRAASPRWLPRGRDPLLHM